MKALAPDQWFYLGIANTMGGVWKNVDDGQNITYANWASGEPKTDHSYCAIMNGNGQWKTSWCYSGYSNVCGFSRVTSSETGSTAGMKP